MLNKHNLMARSNFKESPGVITIIKGLPFFPAYTATFENYIASVPYNSLDLSFSIADPTAIQYDTTLHGFVGLSDTLTTYAVINYKGLTDTIYFVNSVPLNSGCINRTVVSGNWKNPSIWEKSMVPGICDSVIISTGHIVDANTTAQISSLYISTGSSLNINDSTINIRIGETDDGQKSIINNGTVNIQKGRVFVKGRLHYRAIIS